MIHADFLRFASADAGLSSANAKREPGVRFRETEFGIDANCDPLLEQVEPCSWLAQDLEPGLHVHSAFTCSEPPGSGSVFLRRGYDEAGVRRRTGGGSVRGEIGLVRLAGIVLVAIVLLGVLAALIPG